MSSSHLNRACRIKAGLLLFIVAVLILGTAHAEVLVVHGQLLDDQGRPFSGLVPIEFSIHDSPTEDSKLWAETLDVEVFEGLFSATLGTDVTIDQALFAAPDRWLSIEVDGAGEQAGRFRISTNPMSIRAGAAESLPRDSLDGSQLEAGALTPQKLGTCEVGQVIAMGADGWFCKTPGVQP